MTANSADPVYDLRPLVQAIERLNASRFIQMHNSLPRLLAISFLKGLALGLGTVVGATILVSVVVLVLSNIDFIPIVGDWAGQIADQMATSR